jgi:hypothetical protein
VKTKMENIPQQPNDFLLGEGENQSAIMLAQHTTYFLKYKIKINTDGSQEMECQEILDFVEPYNPDYPLAYLKNGQKALAAMSRAQSKAYDVASKILSNLNANQTILIQQATGKEKYDLIAQFLSQDSASNLKYCVDYFNHYSRRKQALISGSRTSGQNPQQMRMFRSPIESIGTFEEKQQKKGFFR